LLAAAEQIFATYAFRGGAGDSVQQLPVYSSAIFLTILLLYEKKNSDSLIRDMSRKHHILCNTCVNVCGKLDVISFGCTLRVTVAFRVCHLERLSLGGGRTIRERGRATLLAKGVCHMAKSPRRCMAAHR
jgi:hypothetical protein